MQSEFDINDLVREAQFRWLKPAEVYFILQNCEDRHLLSQSAKKPPSGSICLYNKRVLRNFRIDGHNWRKKKDGRTVGEAHERLKVGNVEALNCYYAHGEDNPSFRRRSFWMLSGKRDHIVLVQYLDVENQSPVSVSQPSVLISRASTFSLCPSTATNQESIFIGGGYESQINLTSPLSAEISSDIGISKNVVESYNSLGKTSEAIPSDTEANQALRRLEEQLSLDDDNLNEINSFSSQNGTLNSQNCEDFLTSLDFANDGPLESILDGSDYIAADISYGGVKDGLSLFMHEAGDPGIGHQQISSHFEPGRDKDSLSWADMVEFGECISPSLEGAFPQSNGNLQGLTFSSFMSSQLSSQDRNMSFDTEKTFIQPQSCSNLTVGQKQKFSIRDVSPEWGYSFETTKVIIVGSFLCHPTENAWTCMFGDTEVPIQIIQEGVILCEAPPKSSGKVTLCITSANRESCSEVREFEYRSKTSNCTQCATDEKETTMSSEELSLLVRLAQMLLCGSVEERDDNKELGNAIPKLDNFNENSWGVILGSLSDGNGTFAGTMTWLLQKFIKDKLLAWLSSETQEGSGESYCLLSRKQQGIIHLIAGLGYEWALKPILNSGVNINFRDINGWTALHWAAHLGREMMVACLIASGALAGAVTDPNGQDPTGKTPASIAAINGHKGLAGYLSEAALTSHLSSLTLQESGLSKGLAVLEAEHTVSRISEDYIHTFEDQLSLNDTLAAVRNAASAAARIQAAYRAHSFRKRQQRKSFNALSIEDYGFGSDDVPGLSAVSKFAFRNKKDRNSAALSIQKKFRGYKGRKAFVDFRQKVVKIQAHVRGHLTRKSYVVCWATGIVEKVILRWLRKGVGLRGFKPEAETIDESDTEDIARVFRKKNVEGAIEEAVSRVLSMVESLEARKQYRRILESYRQAKAQLGNTANEEASGSGSSSMDNDQTLQDSFSLDY